MILTDKGQSVEYCGTKFSVGDEVVAVADVYEGLVGTITKIKYKSEGDIPSLICSFQVPILKSNKERFRKKYSKFTGKSTRLKDIKLDNLKMRPDNIVPLDKYNDKKSGKSVFVLIEDACNDYITDVNVEVFSNLKTARTNLELKLRNEFEGGMLSGGAIEGCVIEESTNSYECYEDGFHAQWHYSIRIEKEEIKN